MLIIFCKVVTTFILIICIILGLLQIANPETEAAGVSAIFVPIFSIVVLYNSDKISLIVEDIFQVISKY